MRKYLEKRNLTKKDMKIRFFYKSGDTKAIDLKNSWYFESYVHAKIEDFDTEEDAALEFIAAYLYNELDLRVEDGYLDNDYQTDFKEVMKWQPFEDIIYQTEDKIESLKDQIPIIVKSWMDDFEPF